MNEQSKIGNGAGLAALTLAVASVAGGCGFMEMAKDPTHFQETAKLMQEPAPLAVVVRRVDVASATAAQVDRLLTATPVDLTSTWPKQTQLSPDDVTASHKQLADHPYYDNTKWLIVPAEVWVSTLSAIKSDSGQSPSLLAAISPDLGAGYANIQAKIDTVGALEKNLKTEEDARDQKDAADADKRAHQAAADALKPQIDAARKEIGVARTAFETSCQTAAAKAAPEARAGFSAAVVNLRRAVHDAKKANLAAGARYPFLAVQISQHPMSLKDDLVTVAKGNVSDILYEQLGSRLKFQATPQIAYDNGKVDVTLNGIASSDLGKVSLEQLLAETVLRTGRFAIEAVTLPVVIALTEEKLDFEADVLDGIESGFRAAGESMPAPTELALKTSVEVRAGGTASQGVALNPFARGK